MLEPMTEQMAALLTLPYINGYVLCRRLDGSIVKSFKGDILIPTLGEARKLVELAGDGESPGPCFLRRAQLKVGGVVSDSD